MGAIAHVRTRIGRKEGKGTKILLELHAKELWIGGHQWYLVRGTAHSIQNTCCIQLGGDGTYVLRYEYESAVY